MNELEIYSAPTNNKEEHTITTAEAVEQLVNHFGRVLHGL
jgi:hypothetical protein